MRRTTLLFVCALLGCLMSAAVILRGADSGSVQADPNSKAVGAKLSDTDSVQAKPADAGSAEAEPTVEECVAAVEKARGLAGALPPDDISRYFAERYLLDAMSEAGNREYDECLELAEQATDEVREHRHILKPGEKLNIRRADE